MLRFITSLTVFFFSIVYANNNSGLVTHNLDKGKRLLLNDEKFVDALRFFTTALGNATQLQNQKAEAENIYWIAECLFQMRSMNQLNEVLKAGEYFMQLNKNDSLYSYLILIKSKYLIDIGKNKEAIQLLLKTSKTNSKDFTNMKELILADAFYRSGKLEISKKLYESIIHNTDDSIQAAQSFNGIGSYYFMTSEFDSAGYYYEKALLIYRRNKGVNYSLTTSVLYNQALILIKDGNYITSEAKLKEALKVCLLKFGNYHPKTAEVTGTLGNIYMIEDNIGKSIHYFNKELEILLKIYGEFNPKLINCYMNLADIYTANKEFSKAETEIRKAIYLTEKFYNKKNNLYTQCIVKLGILLTQKQQFNAADKLLNEVIRLNRKNPDDYLPDVYLQSGNNLFAQKKYDEASLHYKLANEMYIRFFGEKNIYSVDPLTELSNLSLQKKEFFKALEFASQALEHTIDDHKIVYPYDHWECKLQVLKCKKELYKNNLIPIKNIRDEIEEIKEIINEAVTIKQTYYSSGSQMHYAEKISALNVIGIYFLTHFYHKTDSYFLNNLLFFSENNKANLLRYKISTSASNELLPENESKKLSSVTDKLNYFISLNENRETTSYNLYDSILFYQNLHENLTVSLEKNYPKVYSIKYGQKALTINQIQQNLKNNFTFLSYFNDEERYYCLSVSDKNITFKICGGKLFMDSVILAYQENVIKRKFDTKLNATLSKIILPGNLEEHLIISPDNKIQHIAFDALCENETKNYLIYNHTVQHSFSCSTYFNHPPIKEYKNIIAFFPDFSNTRFEKLNSKSEQKSLSKFSDYKNFSDKSATKNNFIKSSKTANIIHIASHLITDTIFPLESSIVFQPDNDYLLSINNIWKLNTNIQLVTLAACRGNFGKLQQGEGMQNFAWAFYYAGAHHILSAQWDASDKSTSKIISDFYLNLNAGKPKQQALRLAKIKYLKETDAIGSQPFYWANFTLYSDKTEIRLNNYFSIKFLFISLLLTLLSYLAIIKYSHAQKK
jgi:CHAT domain-containing protein